MATSITPISGIASPAQTRAAGETGGGAFEKALSSAIRTVEASRNSASAAVEGFLSGEGAELHTTILAVQRAELTFEMFLQARNKVVSAYQEIMKMQM
jgi:flagellar hook-basal body complex protein FliE